MHKTQKSLSSVFGNRNSRSLKDVVSPKSAESNDNYVSTEPNYDEKRPIMNI